MTYHLSHSQIAIRAATFMWLVHMACTTTLAQSPNLSSEQIQDAADRVMQQNDYRSVRRRVLENAPDDTGNTRDGFLVKTLTRMGQAVGDFVGWIFTKMFGGRTAAGPAPGPAPTPSAAPSSSLNFSFGTMLLYVGLAAIVAVTIWVIAAVVKARDGRRMMDSRGLFDEDGDLTDLSVPPGELAASTYESRAIQMAGDGNYRAAVRELLIGSMSWIERAGLIRFRKGLTNRDYIRAVWRQNEKRLAYGRTAIEFERIYFGRRPATQHTFEECLSQFQGCFREEETQTSAI